MKNAGHLQRAIDIKFFGRMVRKTTKLHLAQTLGTQNRCNELSRDWERCMQNMNLHLNGHSTHCFMQSRYGERRQRAGKKKRVVDMAQVDRGQARKSGL